MRQKTNYTPPTKETRFTVLESMELMTFLLAKMGGMSRNSIKSLLAHRQVMVNDKVTTQFNQLLELKDKVVVNSSRGISTIPGLTADSAGPTSSS